MYFKLSSKALSSSLAALERIIEESSELPELDYFAGCGGLDKMVSVAKKSYDFDQVITYFKEARERDNYTRKENHESFNDIFTDIFTDIFGSAEQSGSTEGAYYLTHGEQGQYNMESKGFSIDPKGYSEAHGVAIVEGYGLDEGLRVFKERSG